MLNRRCGQCVADVSQQVGARRMFVCKHADLDQFVAAETAVDFLQDGCSETVVADYYDGMQGVRTGTEFAALGRCEFECHDCAGV